MTNTHILAFMLGYQGGTVHQIAQELGVETAYIIDATDGEMENLMRKAQRIFWQRGRVNALLVKHLGKCCATLKAQYDDPDAIPAWLERAQGVCNIIGECYPPATGG